MRKLLYAFVFASILMLARFTSFASFDEPGDGGTVPAYQVWLPVVERGSAPTFCLPADFIVADRVYWILSSIPFDTYLGVLDTIYPILAIESDFREDSIIAEGFDPNGPWTEGNHFQGIMVDIPGEFYQKRRRYYSRLDYQCAGYSVRVERSDILY